MRKIIQIALESDFTYDSDCVESTTAVSLWALCNDDTIWYTFPKSTNKEYQKWFQFDRPIPQPSAKDTSGSEEK